MATYHRVERAVAGWVRKANLEPAIARCEKELTSLPATEYQRALGRSWLKQVDDAAKWLARFFQKSNAAITVRALYCEMNRFEINPDKWYVDGFAYDFWGDPEDIGWLCGWKIETGKSKCVLRGMEDLQALFHRDADGPPPAQRASSELVILLLTLRMQELMHAAAMKARDMGTLPEDVPVLATAHDCDLMCFSYGKMEPKITRVGPSLPAPTSAPKPPGSLIVYEMDCGWDEFRNSLPWHVLDYASMKAEEKYTDMLNRAKPLSAAWVAPRVKLRRRKWDCDFIELYPHWAVGDKAKSALAPLLKKTVEFLPLHCTALSPLWVMHPLRHINLAATAVHNGTDEDPMTAIYEYAFEAADLHGKHLFGVRSPTRADDACYQCNCASGDFRRVVEKHNLRGVVFDEIFSIRPRERRRA